MRDTICRIHRRSACHVLLAAALAGIGLGMSGCESPLLPDYAGRGAYTDGLIARSIMDGSYAHDVLPAPTIARGVQEEYARVDSPGPADAATAPAATRSAYSVTGLAATKLNMPEPVFDLSLQDAVARAMKNSLAIKVEGYNPAIKESLIIQAEANFDPVGFFQSQWQSLDDPQLTPGVSVANGIQWANQVGVRRILPTGGQAQVSIGSTYRDLASELAPGEAPLPGQPNTRVLRPDLSVNNYAANINLKFTQPLARGFGADVNQANIYLAQRDQKISLETFRRQVITTVANVETAYWNLVLQRTNVETQDRLVRASAQTYDLVKSREPIDATKASINQALSALESRRGDLLLSQRALRQASDDLKTLLNDPELNIRDNTLINPTDKPVVEPILYSTADCIETALRQRTELQQARLEVERADIIVRVAKNDLLPKVDLIVGMQTNGLASQFDNAFSSTVNPMNAVDWNAGVSIEFPLGNRGAEAALRQRELERKAAITHIVDIAQSIVAEVKGNMRDLGSSYEEIQLRERQRVAAGLELEGIIDIEDIRAKSPEFLQLKLDSQQRLQNAEQQLTQSIVFYNVAIMKLEQSKGTLLEYNRISLDRPPPAEEDTSSKHYRFLGQNH